jgi:hypothetical protein
VDSNGARLREWQGVLHLYPVPGRDWFVRAGGGITTRVDARASVGDMQGMVVSAGAGADAHLWGRLATTTTFLWSWGKLGNLSQGSSVVSRDREYWAFTLRIGLTLD